jgi:hypothetical protein
MTGFWIALAIVVVLVGLYLSQTAGRLDRLHHRVDTGLANLDVQLLRRSGAVLDIASSGLIDPASSMVLVDAAANARSGIADPIDRAQRESDLTRALAAVLGSREDVEALSSTEVGAELVDSLAGAVHRTEMSRRFYNDAVRATLQVRRQRLVRWFRLAGSAPWPRTVEMDDTIPAGLAGR